MNNKIVTLKPLAEHDLESIYDYSSHQWGETKAAQYILDIDYAFNRLAENPNLGINYSHVREELYAYIVGSHILFYKTSNDGIIVIRVLHQNMDFKRHI